MQIVIWGAFNSCQLTDYQLTSFRYPIQPGRVLCQPDYGRVGPGTIQVWRKRKTDFLPLQPYPSLPLYFNFGRCRFFSTEPHAAKPYNSLSTLIYFGRRSSIVWLSRPLPLGARRLTVVVRLMDWVCMTGNLYLGLGAIIGRQWIVSCRKCSRPVLVSEGQWLHFSPKYFIEVRGLHLLLLFANIGHR